MHAFPIVAGPSLRHAGGTTNDGLPLERALVALSALSDWPLRTRSLQHRAATTPSAIRPGDDPRALHVLLQTVPQRHPTLDQHHRRVAALASRVGDHLRLGRAHRDVLVRAARLHDIGKVEIPEEILDRAGPLTDAERDWVRRHTLIGERILGTVPHLAAVAAVVRSTHERWDGRGYPDKLDGERIPLAARIIAICDAYDVITTDRPYHHRESHAAALAELRCCSGSQFDPSLVDVFARVIDEPPAVETPVRQRSGPLTSGQRPSRASRTT